MPSCPRQPPGLLSRLSRPARADLTAAPVLQPGRWIDRIKVTESGETWYRVNERFGTYGDILWGPAEAFRPLTAEEISLIHPEAEEKKVVVNLRLLFGPRLGTRLSGSEEGFETGEDLL